MAKRYFDGERDYMAGLVPDFYDDPASKDISSRYRPLWNVLCGSAIRKVFGTLQVPKTATAEQIDEAKAFLRTRIDQHCAKFRTASMGEQTEPAE